MRFCPDCGIGHDCEVQAVTRTDPNVEIARINAERDVTLFKLGARAQREELETVEAVAEVQAEADVASAAAAAQIIASTADEPEADPVIIDAPPVGDPEPGPDPQELPPAEGTPVPESPRSRRLGLGAWLPVSSEHLVHAIRVARRDLHRQPDRFSDLGTARAGAYSLAAAQDAPRDQ